MHRSIDLPGEDIQLRTFLNEDIDPLFDAVVESIDELLPWMSWCHEGFSKDELELFLNNRDADWANKVAYGFAIIRPSDGWILGTCGINFPNWQFRLANLGYWVRKSAKGQGIASKSTRAIAAWALKELELNRIEIVVGKGNQASFRVGQKAGAHYEGLLKNRLTIRDHVMDAHMFCFVPSDFEIDRQTQGFF